MHRKLRLAWVYLILGCLLPSVSIAEWILIESSETSEGISVRELNDQIEKRGSMRLFTVRGSYRSKGGSPKQGEFYMDYVADCEKGVIKNVKAVAYVNGQKMEGPPTPDPIVMPSKPFEKIYPYACM